MSVRLLDGRLAARAAVFDFNGTITDDEGLLYEIFAELVGGLGVELGREAYFRDLVGLDDREIVVRALAAGGVEPEPDVVERLVRGRIDRYQERARSRPPVRPGSVALVRALAGRVPLAIASGAFREELELVLGVAGIRGCFDAVVAAEDVARGKPDPEGYAEALARLRRARPLEPPLAAGEVVVFEDSAFGVASARAAGMRVVAVLGTKTAEELREADAVLPELGPELLDGAAT